MLDLLNNIGDRLQFIKETKSADNLIRKNESFKQYEIVNDRLKKHVTDYLLSQFSQDTVLEMPVVSSINLAKRVIEKQASVYASAPDREFSQLSEEQDMELEDLLAESNLNQKLSKANKYFKLQGQALLMILPKDGELDIRVLMQHHYDVIPSDTNPEEAAAYVISTYDRAIMMAGYSDNTNQGIADADDYKARLERYLVWTEEANFVFNGKGEILGDILPNPLGNLDMFIDISIDKDFEYFVRGGSSVTDFAIQYCGALSDLGNVIKLQGYAVAFMTGDSELMPKSLTVGPNKILLLPQNANNPVRTEFGFASPSPDVAGSIKYIETLLSNFLTSRGLDGKLVNGAGDSSKYASGIERLLALIEEFSASKNDFDLFKSVEEEVFDAIKQWAEVTYNTDMAFLTFKFPYESDLSVKFYEPTMIQSEAEKLANIQVKRDLGLMSRVEAIAYDRNVDEVKALEIMQKIDAESTEETKQMQDLVQSKIAALEMKVEGTDLNEKPDTKMEELNG
jgi:hypothetical protein